MNRQHRQLQTLRHEKIINSSLMLIFMLLLNLGIISADAQAQDATSEYEPKLELNEELYAELAQQLNAIWSDTSLDLSGRQQLLLETIALKTGLELSTEEQSLFRQVLNKQRPGMTLENFSKVYLPLKELCFEQNEFFRPGAFGILATNQRGETVLIPVSGACITDDSTDGETQITTIPADPAAPLFNQVGALQAEIALAYDVAAANSVAPISPEVNLLSYGFDLAHADAMLDVGIDFNTPAQVEALIREYLNVDPALCRFFPSELLLANVEGGVARGLTLDTPQGQIHFCMLRGIVEPGDIITDLQYTLFLDTLKAEYGIDLRQGIVDVSQGLSSQTVFFVHETADSSKVLSNVSMFNSVSMSFAVVDLADPNANVKSFLAATVAIGSLLLSGVGAYAVLKARSKKEKKTSVNQRKEQALEARRSEVTAILNDLRPMLLRLMEPNLPISVDYLANIKQTLINYYNRFVSDGDLQQAMLRFGTNGTLDASSVEALVSYHPNSIASLFARAIVARFENMTVEEQLQLLGNVDMQVFLEAQVMQRLQTIYALQNKPAPGKKNETPVPEYVVSIVGRELVGSYVLDDVLKLITGEVKGGNPIRELKSLFVAALALDEADISTQLASKSDNRIGRLFSQSGIVTFYYADNKGMFLLIDIDPSESSISVSSPVTKTEVERLQKKES